ncbi:hypothetical protein AAZX31_13G242800 [Glycine max]|nr:hypothetical protein GLYMA_13G259950v4 [Glycine max]KAH1103436.1 hypothetical protein GYH30_037405 [Glycine max]
MKVRIQLQRFYNDGNPSPPLKFFGPFIALLHARCLCSLLNPKENNLVIFFTILLLLNSLSQKKKLNTNILDSSLILQVQRVPSWNFFCGAFGCITCRSFGRCNSNSSRC